MGVSLSRNHHKSSVAPCQHEEQGQDPNNRVDTHRTRQQEVQVHEHAEEGGNTGQHTKDQAQAADTCVKNMVTPKSANREDNLVGGIYSN
jgi:hypothetical protein